MLNKIKLLAFFAMLSFCAQAQENQSETNTSNFGFTSGIIESRFDVANVGQIKEIYNPGGFDGSGMFLGLTFDTGFSKDFGLNSELLWAKLDDSDRYLLSTSLKYRLFNSNFHALGGMELNYLGDTPKNESGEENVKRAGLNGLLGVEYEITNHISVFGNFSFEMTNRFKDYDGSSKHGYDNGRLGVKFKI